MVYRTGTVRVEGASSEGPLLLEVFLRRRIFENNLGYDSLPSRSTWMLVPSLLGSSVYQQESGPEGP